MSLVERVL